MKTSFYLQVMPVRNRWYKDANGDYKVDSIRAQKITQKRPEAVPGDAVVCKITIDMPAEAFAPVMPEALVVVPEDLINRDLLVAVAQGDGYGDES